MAINTRSSGTGLAGLLIMAAGAYGQLSEPTPYAVFALDADLHAVYLMQDLNFDGDVDDPGERWPFLDHTNALGVPLLTSELTSLCRSDDWPAGIFVVDKSRDKVYRALNKNNDKDALDEGEMIVWWDGMLNGVRVGETMHFATYASDRVFVQVGGSQTFRNGAIIWTEDMNNDGDALDPGEAGEWISGTFDHGYIGSWSEGFVLNKSGSGRDQVILVEDDNRDGIIQFNERYLFIEDGNLAGVPVSTQTLGANNSTLYLIGDTSGGEPLTLWKLRDFNHNNVIDLLSEVEQIWDESHLPAGVTLGEITSASMSRYSHVTTIAFDDGASNRFILRLVDRDGDGTFNGPNETDVWASDPGPGVFPERIVGLEVVGSGCYADCDQSTGFGVLDVFDFLCFQDAFVKQLPYACDCDIAGINQCDIFDFLCFQNEFVRGCF